MCLCLNISTPTSFEEIASDQIFDIRLTSEDIVDESQKPLFQVEPTYLLNEK